MSKKKIESSIRRKASTPEMREQQIAASAMDLAERQIRKGTASSQTINHYLDIGSPLYKLKMKKAAYEIELIKAKIEEAKQSTKLEAMYADAMTAMRTYKGEDDSEKLSNTDDSG